MAFPVKPSNPFTPKPAPAPTPKPTPTNSPGGFSSTPEGAAGGRGHGGRGSGSQATAAENVAGARVEVPVVVSAPQNIPKGVTTQQLRTQESRNVAIANIRAGNVPGVSVRGNIIVNEAGQRVGVSGSSSGGAATVYNTKTGEVLNAPKYTDEQGRGYSIDPTKAAKSVQQVNPDIDTRTGKPFGVESKALNVGQRYSQQIKQEGVVKGTLGFIGSEAVRVKERAESFVYKKGEIGGLSFRGQFNPFYGSEQTSTLVGYAPQAAYFTPAGPLLLAGGGIENIWTPAGKEQRANIQYSLTKEGSLFPVSPTTARIASWIPVVSEIGLGGLAIASQVKGIVEARRITAATKEPNIFITGSVEGDKATLTARAKVLDKEFIAVSKQKLLSNEKPGALSSVGQEVSLLKSPKEINLGYSYTSSINKALENARKIKENTIFINQRNLLDSSIIKTRTPTSFAEGTTAAFGRSMTKQIGAATISPSKLKGIGLLDRAGESPTTQLFMGATEKGLTPNAPIVPGKFLAVYEPLSAEAAASLKTPSELALKNMAMKSGQLGSDYFRLIGTSKPVMRVYRTGEVSYIIKEPNILGIIKVGTQVEKARKPSGIFISAAEETGDIQKLALKRLAGGETIGERARSMLLQKKGSLGQLQFGGLVSDIGMQVEKAFAPKIIQAQRLIQVSKTMSEVGGVSMTIIPKVEQVKQTTRLSPLVDVGTQKILLKEQLFNRENLMAKEMLKLNVIEQVGIKQNILQGVMIQQDILSKQNLKQEQVKQSISSRQQSRTERLTVPLIPPIMIPSMSSLSLLQLKLKAKKRKNIYEIWSKRFGKEFSLGKFSEQATAERKLKGFIGSTLARSGKITEDNILLPVSRLKSFSSREFRPSKKSPYTFVQRNPLAARSEVREILGYKRKKKKSEWF